MLHLRRYLGALAVVLTAYGGYALLASPWLEPRALGRGSSMASLPPVRVDESFRELFEPGSWELDDPKIVETAHCTLLLRDYQPLPDGRMEINPCTLIFYAGGSPASGASQTASQPRRPIVLRALQGAVLQFDRPIDVGRATVGRLTEGTLRGQIRIFSPPTRPGANDALELTTRNVKISRDKVYTPSVVEFRYGASFGRGRDLKISLMPEDKEKRSSSPSTVGGLSVLELTHVDRLHLEGHASGILPHAESSQSPSPAENLPLEVHCDGPLVVDFEDNVAALDENVEISRVYPQGPPDRLTCDRLIFHLFDRKSPRPAHTKTAEPAAPPMDARQLAQQVERVIAVGTPVVLDAPQAGVYARADRAEYAAANQRISLASGKSASQVTLRYQECQFEAREIAYELAEPGRLGRLWAAGPGRLKFVPPPGQGGQSVEAAWQKKLTIAPHDKNKVISLTGQPLVQLGGGGTFSTSDLEHAAGRQPGEIHLWVLEVPREPLAADVSAAPAHSSAGKTSAAKPAPRFVILPDRMLATGRVEVDSPQLAAHTRELQTWFLHPPTPAAPPSKPGAMFDPLPQPDDPPADDPTKLQKLDVAANLVQLQILRRGRQSAVEKMTLTGGVKVAELAPSGPAAQGPLEIQGEQVTLLHGTSDQAKLEIHGNPPQNGRPAEHAKVSARGLSLSGATIHLRRRDNRLWIPGPGEATLPMPVEAADPRPLTPPPDDRSSASGRPVFRMTHSGPEARPAPRPTRPFKVTWRDGFEFDGQKGVFSGAIEARGQAEFAAGEVLTVTLNQRFDFAAPRQQGRIEVARLQFAGGTEDVNMQRVLYDEMGKPTAVENARVRNLDIDQATGKIFAAGPGEVWTVRRDLKSLAGGGLAPGVKPDANKLSYVCVTFQGQIVGDLHRREIQFQRVVDTVYGQVGGWNERVAATRVEELGEAGVHMQSDTLTLTEMSLSPQRKWIEIDASGNTLAEGIKFVARAARISYTTDKEQLIIAGDGRVPAELWHRAAPGGPSSYSEARRFIFQRGNGSFQMDDGQIINISSLPAGGKPVPKLR